MLTPTFIESYETEAHDLCDRLVEQVDFLINEWSEGRGGGHVFHGRTLDEWMMDGAVDNGTRNRKDHAFDFYALNNPLCEEVHSLLHTYLQKYVDKHPSFGMHAHASHICKVQKTPPKGGFHQWHMEQGLNHDSFRTLVWTLYLNDMPDGEGETEFLEFGQKVQPKKGRLCFFPAAFTHLHRGNAVYSHDKYIATGWYYLVGE